MISKITETIEDNKLKVVVECNVRRYAKHPIKTLTTEEVIDIIKNKYNIVKTLRVPRKKVGNTKKNYISTSGTWIFQITPEKVTNETKPEKPTKKEQPEQKTTTRTRTRKSTSSSIRSRMSKLATKED